MTRQQFLATFSGLYLTQLLGKNTREKYSAARLLGQEKLLQYSISIPLSKNAGKAFVKMQKAALKEGISLEIVSGYRSYDRQQQIWNRKFIINQAAGLSPIENIQKIIEYSTLPGTSRHHWGCDADLIDGSKSKNGDVLLSEKFHGEGPYTEMRIWMDEYAAKFGFIRPYTNDPNRTGFLYEPWHFSYAPESIPMLEDYLQLPLDILLKTDGLEGKSNLTLDFINQYRLERILGINPLLKSF